MRFWNNHELTFFPEFQYPVITTVYMQKKGGKGEKERAKK